MFEGRHKWLTWHFGSNFSVLHMCIKGGIICIDQYVQPITDGRSFRLTITVLRWNPVALTYFSSLEIMFNTLSGHIESCETEGYWVTNSIKGFAEVNKIPTAPPLWRLASVISVGWSHSVIQWRVEYWWGCSYSLRLSPDLDTGLTNAAVKLLGKVLLSSEQTKKCINSCLICIFKMQHGYFACKFLQKLDFCRICNS